MMTKQEFELLAEIDAEKNASMQQRCTHDQGGGNVHGR